MSQLSRPVADVATASWTSGGGRTTNLYREIDEVSANSADYVHGNSTTGTYKCRLNTFTLPGTNSGWQLDVAAFRTTGSQSITYKLYCNSTLVKTVTRNFVTADATYTNVLTTDEAALITDPAHVYFWVSAANASPDAYVYWVQLTIPDASTSIADKEASLGTLEAAVGSVKVAFIISGVEASLGTLEASLTTTTLTAPGQSWRDVFTAYDASMDRFWVGQLTTTHNPIVGQQSDSSVSFQGFILDMASGQARPKLYRMSVADSYLSAFASTSGWTAADHGGAHEDRPGTMIAGFWSYGAYPTLDAANGTILYELSLPYTEDEAATTNGYPYYTDDQPGEDVFVQLAPQTMKSPGVAKLLTRVKLWLIPREGSLNTTTVTVTVIPHPVNAQADTPISVSRSVTVAGYTTTAYTPARPTKVVYVDFDPANYPTGEAFEVKISLTSAIGLRALKLIGRTVGDERLLDAQV